MILKMASVKSTVSCSGYLLRTLRFCKIIIVLLTVIEGKRITVERCGKNFMVKKPRILRGDVANQGEFPWMVSLQYNNNGTNRHMCGASILNEHWIVTAAHCVTGEKIEALSILAGLEDLNKTEHKAVRRHDLSKIIMHENFGSRRDDIALLRTTKPIDIKGSKGYINGICLPDPLDEPAGWAIVTGWGDTTEGGNNSEVLRAVKVPIVPRESCNNAYDYDPEDDRDIIKQSQICAGIINRDSCQNDSGGPLIQRNKNGFYTLIGIVNWGEGCGRRKYPGVYAKVASYLDWIENNVD